MNTFNEILFKNILDEFFIEIIFVIKSLAKSRSGGFIDENEISAQISAFFPANNEWFFSIFPLLGFSNTVYTQELVISVN